MTGNPAAETGSDWHDVLAGIESAWPSSRYRDVGVIVGCSGGADSIALLRAMNQLRQVKNSTHRPNGFLVAAHFNHRLRGDQSDRDASFVADTARELGIEFVAASTDSNARDEATLRDQRRVFFAHVLRRSGARYLALGHSRDDNVETVLHRLMRGTGPTGLCGIPSFRSLGESDDERDFVIARPMLKLNRQQIRAGLRSIGCRWCEDASNQSLEYQRNWIRLQLIPLIEKRYPDAAAAIDRAIDGQTQWREVISRDADRWSEGIRATTDGWAIQIDSNHADHPPAPAQAVITEALRRCWLKSGWPLREMGRSQWVALTGLVQGIGPDAITLPGNVIAMRTRGRVTLTRQ